MVDAEDLWKEVVDTNNPDNDKLPNSKMKDKMYKEDNWDSEGSEGELDY